MEIKEKLIRLLNDEGLTQEQEEKLLEIFPELAESSDEKVRKWIVDYFNNIALNSTNIEEKVSIKNALVWLEKQKHTEWTKDDKTTLNNLIWALKEDAVLDGDRDVYIKWLMTLESKHHKQDVQSEWTGEDEHIADAIIYELTTSDELSVDVAGAVSWLKSLKSRVRIEEENNKLKAYTDIEQSKKLAEMNSGLTASDKERLKKLLDRLVHNCLVNTADVELLNKLYQKI